MKNLNGKYDSRFEKIIKTIIKSLFFAAIGFLILALFGFVVKWLWNSLLPDIFGVKAITYWQGLGLLVLGRLLFGGFGSDNKSTTRKKEVTTPRKIENNQDYDALYDTWWKEQGETSFEDYLASRNKEE
jgi:hypothetical protein